MISRRTAGRVIFVTSCVVSTVFLTHEICARAPQLYQGALEFQLASSQGRTRPDLQTEEKLLTSDAILTQVLKDVNLMPQPQAARFRSFDLGPQIKAAPVDHSVSVLEVFRKNLDVTALPESSVISLKYKSHDPEEARKIIETLFEKFRDWRQSAAAPKFDSNVVAADQQVFLRREAFLQSQKALLDFVEGENSDNGLISRQVKKAELSAKLESLKLRYGPRHPAMIETIKEINALEAAPSPVSDQEKIKQLRERMEQNFKALDTSIRESVILEQKKSASGNGFEILPLGEVSVKPVPPFTTRMMLVAGFLALCLSLLYLKLRSGMRPVFETRKDIAAFLSYPFIAEISSLRRSDTGEVAMPVAVSSEAIRALRQELKLRAGVRQIKLVTVTSTQADEGRSELIANLGRISARAGEQVLILDADLRAPTMQEKMPVNSFRNLVDYLSGQARIEDVINRTDSSGVHIIYGTAVPNTALDLISSEKMKTLLHSLREVYDLVLVQAPVSIKGPDARVLANLSDQTLYLVEASKTLRGDVKTEQRAFGESGIGNMSVVLMQN